LLIRMIIRRGAKQKPERKTSINFQKEETVARGAPKCRPVKRNNGGSEPARDGGISFTIEGD
jgi:hypothetical protein